MNKSRKHDTQTIKTLVSELRNIRIPEENCNVTAPWNDPRAICTLWKHMVFNANQWQLLKPSLINDIQQ